MIRTTRHLQAIALAAFLISPAQSIHAQEDDTDSDADEAFELYDQAKIEFNEGHFEVAIELLDEALALHAEPILIYNLARAYEGLGEDEEALAYYEDYLDEDPEAENRGAVEGRISALRESLAAGEVRPVETELRPGPWVLLGGGAALALSGIIPGVMSRSSRDDAVAATTGEDAATSIDRADRQALTANVLFGLGGAAALSGLIWAIVGGRRPTHQDEARLEVMPGGLRIRGAF